MSRKNHKIINGRLLQINKPFSQLKQKQKIQQWLYQKYARIYDEIRKPQTERKNRYCVILAMGEYILSCLFWCGS